MSDLQKQFLRFSIEKNILKFGEFVTKFGRISPYFFNAGLFHEGESLYRLANFYAETIIEKQIEFDVIFGPAYKGIVLASTTAIALAIKGINKPFTFNRKETKDHGEKGILIGAPLRGRILIIDDVISAGTSIRESIQIIHQEGAKPCGIIVALDRMEKGITEFSAMEEIKQKYQIPVTAIATLNDLLDLMKNDPILQPWQTKIINYRKQYGTS